MRMFRCGCFQAERWLKAIGMPATRPTVMRPSLAKLAVEIPTGGGRRPAAVCQRGAAGGRWPMAGGRRPGGRRPAVRGRWPVNKLGRRPPASDRRPPATGRRPPAFGHRDQIWQTNLPTNFPTNFQRKNMNLTTLARFSTFWPYKSPANFPTNFPKISLGKSLLGFVSGGRPAIAQHHRRLPSRPPMNHERPNRSRRQGLSVDGEANRQGEHYSSHHFCPRGFLKVGCRCDFVSSLESPGVLLKVARGPSR